MDPFEEAHDEDGDGDDAHEGEVEGGEGEVAVEAVVDGGEGGTGDQHVDAGVVETHEHFVGF